MYEYRQGEERQDPASREGRQLQALRGGDEECEFVAKDQTEELSEVERLIESEKQICA